MILMNDLIRKATLELKQRCGEIIMAHMGSEYDPQELQIDYGVASGVEAARVMEILKGEENTLGGLPVNHFSERDRERLTPGSLIFDQRFYSETVVTYMTQISDTKLSGNKARSRLKLLIHKVNETDLEDETERQPLAQQFTYSGKALSGKGLEAIIEAVRLARGNLTPEMETTMSNQLTRLKQSRSNLNKVLEGGEDYDLESLKRLDDIIVGYEHFPDLVEFVRKMDELLPKVYPPTSTDGAPVSAPLSLEGYSLSERYQVMQQFLQTEASSKVEQDITIAISECGMDMNGTIAEQIARLDGLFSETVFQYVLDLPDTYDMNINTIIREIVENAIRSKLSGVDIGEDSV